MGRVKLEMKYIENLCARHTTYTTRLKGLKKKAEELSVLCGVDIFVASFSPELSCIIGDYEGKGKIKQYSSFSLRSFHEEKAAMEIKLREVRERLEFLQRQHQEEEERGAASGGVQGFHGFATAPGYPTSSTTFSISPISSFSYNVDFEIPSQQELSSHQQASLLARFLPPHEQPTSFSHENFRHLSDFNMSMQQDSHSHEQPFQISQCPPPHDQPLPIFLSLPDEQTYSFSQFLPPHLAADSSTEDPLDFLLPSDSNYWSHLDDFNCYDSLLLDYDVSQVT